MHISRWGNSLAVRLPATLVEALALKEGDEVQIDIADPAHFRLARDTSRDDALAALRALGWHLPPGFRFDREAAHARGA